MSTATRPDGLDGIGRALVIGLGVSGRSAADLLADSGVEVTVVDVREDHPDAAAARATGHRVVLGGGGPAPGDVDLVVPSPGVPASSPELAAALAAGVPVWSEPELAWRVAPRRLLGVTGTNGKTSVTELVTAMLAAAGHTAVACGNIGMPLSTAVVDVEPDATLVAELSSFQLRFVDQLRVEVAVLTNLADDHLDWHGGAADYRAAKARIFRAQHDEDWAVANLDDPATVVLRDRALVGRPAAFSTRGAVPRPGVGVVDGRLVADLPGHHGDVLALADLSLDAPHHHANVAAAATVALLAGAEPDAVADAAADFHPGRHRLELVAEGGGVRWVDDSKATNVHAAAAALASASSIVWVAGGLAKGADVALLTGHLAAVRRAVLIGTSAPELAGVCEAAGVPAELLDSIEEAVELAGRLARPGDTVLLAPACASFDQFTDYAERGRRFAAAARAVCEGGRT